MTFEAVRADDRGGNSRYGEEGDSIIQYLL